MNFYSLLIAGFCLLWFFPVIYRRALVESVSVGLQETAEGLAASMRKHSVTGDDRLRRIHDDFLAIAALSPMIGSGFLITPRVTEPSAQEVEEIEKLASDHPWVAAFLASANCRVEQLFFLARPWHPTQIAFGLASTIALARYKQPDGSVNLAWVNRDLARVADKIERLAALAKKVFNDSVLRPARL